MEENFEHANGDLAMAHVNLANTQQDLIDIQESSSRKIGMLSNKLREVRLLLADVRGELRTTEEHLAEEGEYRDQLTEEYETLYKDCKSLKLDSTAAAPCVIVLIDGDGYKVNEIFAKPRASWCS